MRRLDRPDILFRTRTAGAVRLNTVALAYETDWDGFRRAVRAHILAGTAPDALAWQVGGDDAEVNPLPETSGTFNVSRALVALAQVVICANDPARFALLYGLFWRYHCGERTLMEQTGDPDLHRANRLARAVRRDLHMMRAFLRFRPIKEGTRYVGWYEPEHHIVEAAAAIFARRFACTAWSLLTPRRSAHWDGEAIILGPGVDPADVPDDGALEAAWRARFAALFRPGAVPAALPDGYWRNLPEAIAIPDLIGSAQGEPDSVLEDAMPAKLPLGPVRAAAARKGTGANDTRLAQAAHEAAECRRCDLWKRATQTVFGEGPQDARVMFVGEQPGDQEDLVGRPFVGPAGQLLDRALEEAGVDRRTVYVTNAVKHFKFVPRGKRRIHAKPETTEIVACSHWLDIEREAIQPELIVLLGATAARAVLGRMVTISRERGERIPLDDRTSAFVTVHPSFLLRVPDEDSKAREYRAFVADLRKVARFIGESA